MSKVPTTGHSPGKVLTLIPGTQRPGASEDEAALAAALSASAILSTILATYTAYLTDLKIPEPLRSQLVQSFQEQLLQ